MLNVKEFRVEVARNDGTVMATAKAIKVSYTTLRYQIKRGYLSTDIATKLKAHWSLTSDRACEIFLAQK